MSLDLVNNISKDMAVSKKIKLLDFALAEEHILKNIREVWPRVNKELVGELIGATKQKFRGNTVTNILKVVKDIQEKVEKGAYAYEPRASAPARSPTISIVSTDAGDSIDNDRTPQSEKTSKPVQKTQKTKAALKRKDQNTIDRNQSKKARLSDECKPVHVDLTSDNPGEEYSSEDQAGGAERVEVSREEASEFMKLLAHLLMQDRLESCTMEQIEEHEPIIEMNISKAKIVHILEEMQDANMVMVVKDTVYRM
mmetsp:Transcript_26631/g.32332  ORF Transcript_26631/g.32332 Transcript_26631/m.32332 type:complete len:254 (+) Transcript_26631:308-1069(+)|eukprot:CAMPEP_0197865578 /NCGR_PEP_ID=MMETSP1438-20131217/43745_1 /TAXON_ID=1461541 /ORGANISM="Pterosperma sp., Strain CCMP1384" /LENGTH=253 /DNA_ID=CAMNT_0043484067 /DNA_START=300 /DNA_END=1061 /DNA_ORIENTATION=-